MDFLNPAILNLAYAAMGGLMMLAGGWIAYRLFLNVVGFNVRDELKAGNVAVGLAVMGIFIATGLGMGLVIGLSLN
ncbi:MAG: DUF350 domain-containing protein [Nevskiaceae bacterium]|nr:MAG: DUF350 domain-containing protein [Nevskiaceae bacterium]TBR72758.1 MAG: DUF350 domain-containing protein [Nevskiaceae bacterium]